MSAELLYHIRSLSRFIYFVTEEEDVFLKKLGPILKKFIARTWVFNAAFGLVPIEQLLRDWQTRSHTVNDKLHNIQDALEFIYKEDPKDEQNFYVITDPEEWLANKMVQRRMLNLAHQLHNDEHNIKITIFVGNQKYIPAKLARYIEVVHDTGLTPEEISRLVEHAATALSLPVPENAAEMFRGMTSFEIEASIAQSIVKTKKDPAAPKRLDPQHIADYKRKQILKTDLLSFQDTSTVTADQLGGANRFKKWAKKTRAAWTPKGQKFGLRIPKGVLLVGIWGTGKSLSSKVLANLWGQPLVQLEMGRLRSSGVGDSEQNVYRALRIIENVSPCVVWIDEAEKSLSGGESSSYSDAGTTARTIGIISTWIQETKYPISIVMTANSLKTLPVEFVNRADQRFFFDLPSEEDRIDILKIHLRKYGQDHSYFPLAKLAEAARQLVGREIDQCVNTAMIESFNLEHPALSPDVLLEELKRKPRLVKTMEDQVNEIAKWVGYDEVSNDGIRALYAADPDRVHGSIKVILGGGDKK